MPRCNLLSVILAWQHTYLWVFLRFQIDPLAANSRRRRQPKNRRRAAKSAEIMESRRRRNFYGAPRLAVIIGLVVKLIITATVNGVLQDIGSLYCT